MGFFSTERKRVVGTQYVDMGSNAINDYYQFRRQLIFAAAGDNEYYANNMFKFKQKFRNRYKKNKLAELGFGGATALFDVKTFNEYTSLIVHPDIHSVAEEGEIAHSNYQEAVNNGETLVAHSSTDLGKAKAYALKYEFASDYSFWISGNTYGTTANPYRSTSDPQAYDRITWTSATIVNSAVGLPDTIRFTNLVRTYATVTGTQTLYSVTV
ncbi:MAG: hypothetical protein KAG66_03395, partial [Methylococcales bacterium]|nr:hypothetical protein [Methylococcales bacterium]